MKPAEVLWPIAASVRLANKRGLQSIVIIRSDQKADDSPETVKLDY